MWCGVCGVVLCCVVVSRLVLSCLVLSCPVLSCPVLSCLVSSRLVVLWERGERKGGEQMNVDEARSCVPQRAPQDATNKVPSGQKDS